MYDLSLQRVTFFDFILGQYMAEGVLQVIKVTNFNSKIKREKNDAKLCDHIDKEQHSKAASIVIGLL